MVFAVWVLWVWLLSLYHSFIRSVLRSFFLSQHFLQLLPAVTAKPIPISDFVLHIRDTGRMGLDSAIDSNGEDSLRLLVQRIYTLGICDYSISQFQSYFALFVFKGYKSPVCFVLGLNNGSLSLEDGIMVGVVCCAVLRDGKVW